MDVMTQMTAMTAPMLPIAKALTSSATTRAITVSSWGWLMCSWCSSPFGWWCWMDSDS